MIELRTLGAVHLTGADSGPVSALLHRPKRFAVLAYLALSRPDESPRRDTLLAMFWPEADTVRARGALRQAVHVIRGALGADVLVTTGDDDLRIAPTLLRCDAREFERAVEEGRTNDALALYRGSLMPGFYLHGADGFERWLEATRARLQALALATCHVATDDAFERGAMADAIKAAERGVSLAPHDEPASRRLMAALDRSGNRAAALRVYERLAERLQREFAIPPGAETRDLMLTVRDRPVRSPTAGAPGALGALRAAVEPVAEVGPLAPVVSHAPVAPAGPVVSSVVGARLAAEPHRSSARFLMARRWRGAALFVAALTLTGSQPRRQPPTSLTTPADVVPTRRAAPIPRAAYLRGRHYVEKPTAANLRRAIVAFEEALDADPLDAAAYAGLGDSYLRLGYLNALAPAESFPKARAAAERAIALDSTNAAGYATLGFARMYYDWDWVGAEEAFRHALRLDPRSALAHDWYAYLLTVEGRFGEARSEMALARALDPLSVAIATDAGFVAFYGGRLAESRKLLNDALTMAPEVPAAHLWLGRVEQLEGNSAGAIAHYEATGSLRTWAPTIAALGYVHGVRGSRALAREALDSLGALERRQYVSAYAFALVHAALGERDAAFAALNRAVDERTHWIVWLVRDKRWDPIRGDPRFAAVLRRTGVPR